MLGPSIDQQQLDQQALHDAAPNITTVIAAPDSQAEPLQFQPQSSNPTAHGNGQVFGDKNQQCEKRTTSFYPTAIPTDRIRPWLRRLEP